MLWCRRGIGCRHSSAFILWHRAFGVSPFELVLSILYVDLLNISRKNYLQKWHTIPFKCSVGSKKNKDKIWRDRQRVNSYKLDIMVLTRLKEIRISMMGSTRLFGINIMIVPMIIDNWYGVLSIYVLTAVERPWAATLLGLLTLLLISWACI